MSKKVATICIWNDYVLVDYIDKDRNESSYIIKNDKDIKGIKKELIEAGYFKKELKCKLKK